MNAHCTTDTCQPGAHDAVAGSPEVATAARTAIVVLADPRSGDEESLGRVFNALATAYDYSSNGEEVSILFQGAGTRWIGELSQADHPAHELFQQVKNSVAGVSCGCADVFGGTEDARHNGFDLIKDNMVPGTGGLPSLRTLINQGYHVLTF